MNPSGFIFNSVDENNSSEILKASEFALSIKYNINVSLSLSSAIPISAVSEITPIFTMFSWIYSFPLLFLKLRFTGLIEISEIRVITEVSLRFLMPDSRISKFSISPSFIRKSIYTWTF